MNNWQKTALIVSLAGASALGAWAFRRSTENKKEPVETAIVIAKGDNRITYRHPDDNAVVPTEYVIIFEDDKPGEEFFEYINSGDTISGNFLYEDSVQYCASERLHGRSRIRTVNGKNLVQLKHQADSIRTEQDVEYIYGEIQRMAARRDSIKQLVKRLRQK